MTIEISPKLYTVKEFLELEWDDEDDNEYELVEGEIVAKQGTTSGKHGDVFIRLGTELNLFAGVKAGEKRLGTVFGETSCTLGRAEGLNYPKPDISFVLRDRIPDDFEGPIPVAPDLVVEINSPSDTDQRKLDKIQAYQQAGVRLIWSIQLLEKYVVVYRLNKPRSFLDLDDELDGEDVIPGFRLKVRSLFD